MKIPSMNLREAVDVCQGSRLYPLLTRQEKREAVIYCEKIIGVINEKVVSK
jgi:hypothetical protein